MEHNIGGILYGKSYYREYLQGENVGIKKYFYVLRPILACKWIEDNNTMPPMEFKKLLETQIRDENLYNEISILLERKKLGDELDIEPRIDIINKFSMMNFYIMGIM